MPSVHHTGGKWCHPTTRLAIYLRDGFRCVWCDKCLTGAHPKDVTLDHVVPREQNGSNHARNLVTACKACNSARGTLGIRAYARLIAPNDALGVVRRVTNACRRAPNKVLARAIRAGTSPDPRPIVSRARAAGRTLAPRGSAADLFRTGALDPVATGRLGQGQRVPF